jgi:TolB protein
MLLPQLLSMPRRPRRLPSGLLLVALGCALAACDGSDQPLAPAAEDPAVGAAAGSAQEPAAGELAAPSEDLAAALVGARIAFSSNKQAGQNDIYVMDPQGNNRTRLTSWAGDEMEPAWSRDNQRLAFIRRRADVTNTMHWDVFIMDADGTHKHWARSTPSGFDIMDPSWSPDGKHLVVRVGFGGSSYLATLELGTGNMDFVRDNTSAIAAGEYPSYSPSGASIVYVGDKGGSLLEVYPDGDPYRLVSGAAAVGRPVWSPDGKKIVFNRLVGANMDVYVLTRATSAVKRLTTNAAWDGNASWSKDGTKIVFGSTRSGLEQIWMVSAAGGTQTRISHTSVWEDFPAYSY